MSQTGASHAVACSRSFASRQHPSPPNPAITQHVSGKRAGTVPPAPASWAALSCAPESYGELFSTPRAARNMGIKRSTIKPSHYCKSWGFRGSLKRFGDAQDNLHCVRPWHGVSIPRQWGGSKAMGIPASTRSGCSWGCLEPHCLQAPSKISSRKQNPGLPSVKQYPRGTRSLVLACLPFCLGCAAPSRPFGKRVAAI